MCSNQKTFRVGQEENFHWQKKFNSFDGIWRDMVGISTNIFWRDRKPPNRSYEIVEVCLTLKIYLLNTFINIFYIIMA